MKWVASEISQIIATAQKSTVTFSQVWQAQGSSSAREPSLWADGNRLEDFDTIVLAQELWLEHKLKSQS